MRIHPVTTLALFCGLPTPGSGQSPAPTVPSVVRIEAAGQSTVHALLPLEAHSDYLIVVIPVGVEMARDPWVIRLSTQVQKPPDPAPPPTPVVPPPPAPPPTPVPPPEPPPTPPITPAPITPAPATPAPTPPAPPESTGPAPTSALAPGRGRLYVTLVHASQDRTMAQFHMPGLADRFASLGVTWRAIDDKARRLEADGTMARKTILEESGLAGRYPRSGTPTLIIQDEAGRILRNREGVEAGIGVVSPAPTDPAEVIGLVKAIKAAH